MFRWSRWSRWRRESKRSHRTQPASACLLACSRHKHSLRSSRHPHSLSSCRVGSGQVEHREHHHATQRDVPPRGEQYEGEGDGEIWELDPDAVSDGDRACETDTLRSIERQGAWRQPPDRIGDIPFSLRLRLFSCIPPRARSRTEQWWLAVSAPLQDYQPLVVNSLQSLIARADRWLTTIVVQSISACWRSWYPSTVNPND